MREVISAWASAHDGWEVKSHGHRYSVHQHGHLRLICNDAPTRGYTNVFVKGSTPARLGRILSSVNPLLVREDIRYGGTTLHISPEFMGPFLRSLSNYFGK